MAERKHRHRPPPQAVDTQTSPLGLRAIATFEALKGFLVFAAALGLLTLLHKDVGEVAEHVVHRLHMNPEGHISQVFLRAAEKVTDAKLWAAAAGALAYSTVRFVEAYGLWNARVWAEWFALLSGSLYLPWEIFELIVRPTPLRWVLFSANIAVVLYMLYIRVRDCRPVGDEAA